jgi:hypothetical protein
MKTDTKFNSGALSRAFPAFLLGVVAAALCVLPATGGGQIFETNSLDNTIGEYTTSGTTVNSALISGLNFPEGIALSGGNLFVANRGNGTIGEYTTSGATVNSALVSGLNSPTDIAVVSAPVPDESSTWTLLLVALTATFGLKLVLRQPV